MRGEVEGSEEAMSHLKPSDEVEVLRHLPEQKTVLTIGTAKVTSVDGKKVVFALPQAVAVGDWIVRKK